MVGTKIFNRNKKCVSIVFNIDVICRSNVKYVSDWIKLFFLYSNIKS